MVRRERSSGGAPGDRVERRAFDFDEPFAGERLANRRNDLRSVERALEDAVGVNEVDVTHSRAEFRVVDSLELVGRRLDRFAQEVDVGREDGQFAALRLLEFAVDADQVAEVDAEREFPGLFGNLVFPDHNLDFAAPILNRPENELSLFALEHHATGDADLRAARRDFGARRGAFVFRREFDRFADDDFAFASADVADQRAVVETPAPRIDPHFFDFAQFFASRRL